MVIHPAETTRAIEAAQRIMTRPAHHIHPDEAVVARFVLTHCVLEWPEKKLTPPAT